MCLEYEVKHTHTHRGFFLLPHFSVSSVLMIPHGTTLFIDLIRQPSIKSINDRSKWRKAQHFISYRLSQGNAYASNVRLSIRYIYRHQFDFYWFRFRHFWTIFPMTSAIALETVDENIFFPFANQNRTDVFERKSHAFHCSCLRLSQPFYCRNRF